MNGMLFLENFLLEKPTSKYGIKFSSAPILLSHFCVLFTQMEEAKQNICLFTGQRCFCCLLDLIELKLMWSIRISENVSKAKWKSVIFLGYLNKCGNIAERSWRVLEAATLAYAYKTKESITFQKLSSYYFLPVANNVPNKGKFAIPWPGVLSFASDEAKVFANKFARDNNLDDSDISLPVFPF